MKDPRFSLKCHQLTMFTSRYLKTTAMDNLYGTEARCVIMFCIMTTHPQEEHVTVQKM